MILLLLFLLHAPGLRAAARVASCNAPSYARGVLSIRLGVSFFRPGARALLLCIALAIVIRRLAAAVTAFTRYCAETCPQAAHTPRGKYGGCARFVCQDGFLYSYEKKEMLCGFSQNAMFPVLCGFRTNGWCGPPLRQRSGT